MAIDAMSHSGNPQDGYNKIQNGNYPYAKMQEEAEYILEESATAGVYSLTKKPTGCVMEQVTDVWGFIEDKNKVLIVTADGRFNRFNFDPKFYLGEEEVADTPAKIVIGVPTGMTADPASVDAGAITKITLDKGTASALPTAVTVTVDGTAVDSSKVSYVAATGVITLTGVTANTSIVIAAAS